MIKLTAFTSNIYAEYNFLKDEEIDNIISSIDVKTLDHHGALVGNAKSTYNVHTKGMTKTNYHGDFLKDHKYIKNRLIKASPITKLRITNSWCNVQGKHSKLNYHNHPDSILSGIIFLQVDKNSSKLYFRNPNSKYFNIDDDVSITPERGLMLMWPSWLLHGSGGTENKSDERIVLSFNTFYQRGDNA